MNVGGIWQPEDPFLSFDLALVFEATEPSLVDDSPTENPFDETDESLSSSLDEDLSLREARVVGIS